MRSSLTAFSLLALLTACAADTIGDEPGYEPVSEPQTIGVAQSLGSSVIAYSDFFAGKTQTFQPGIYDLDQFLIENDTISSIHVPAGWKVTLFEHAGLQGHSKVLTADSTLDDFNDITSSLIVLGSGSDGAMPAMEMISWMGSQLAENAFGFGFTEVFSVLFPSSPLDVESLLNDIEDRMRKVIREAAFAGKEGDLAGAMTRLHEYDVARQMAGQPGAMSIARIYDLATHDSTLNQIDNVLGALGDAASDPEMQVQGLNVYRLAAQLKANRLMLQMKLSPDNRETNRKWLLDHLTEASGHVRRVIDRQRVAAIDDRLSKIIGCATTPLDTRGPPWALTWLTHWFDNGPSVPGEPITRGDSQAQDRGVAEARCFGGQHPRAALVHAYVASELDAKYKAAADSISQWRAIPHALNNEGTTVGVRTSLLFGGMYGFRDGGGRYLNPYTKDTTCPAGYDAKQITGTFDVDYAAFACVRVSDGTEEPVADFGGMYGRYDYWDGTGWRVNPISGTTGCPGDFVATQVLESDRDHPLFYCSRPHVKGTRPPYAFGGIFNRRGGYANPLSNNGTCPTGFTPSQALGSVGARGTHTDYDVSFCYRANDEALHVWSYSGPCWNVKVSPDAVPEPADCPVGTVEVRGGSTTIDCGNFTCKATEWISSAHAKEFSWGCPSTFPWLPVKVRECEPL